MAARRESRIGSWEFKKIVAEALEDMDRVLDVSAVSKGLKSTFMRTLKRAAACTRGAILHLAAENQKDGKGTAPDALKRMNLEIQNREEEVNELKDEVDRMKTAMLNMRNKLEAALEKVTEYRNKMERLKKEKSTKETGTLPMRKGNDRNGSEDGQKVERTTTENGNIEKEMLQRMEETLNGWLGRKGTDVIKLLITEQCEKWNTRQIKRKSK